jgi:HEAT repeat protein
MRLFKAKVKTEEEKDVKGLIKAHIQTLKDEDNGVRGEASAALSDIGVPAVESLLHALKNKNVNIRMGAADVLGFIGDSEADKKKSLGRGTDEKIRRVEKIIDAKVVEALIQALKDKQPRVQNNAIDALKEIGVPAVEGLIHALKNKDFHVRGGAAEALGMIGDSRADASICGIQTDEKTRRVEEIRDLGGVEALIQALKDEYGFVQTRTAQALGQIGDKRAVKALSQSLTDNSEAGFFAAEALGKIGSPEAVLPLIQALKDNGEFRRRDSAKALGMIGDSRAVEALVQALRDDDECVKSNAFVALKILGWKPVSKVEKGYYEDAQYAWTNQMDLAYK